MGLHNALLLITAASCSSSVDILGSIDTSNDSALDYYSDSTSDLSTDYYDDNNLDASNETVPDGDCYDELIPDNCVVFVNVNSTHESPDGLSWATAIPNIQDGIFFANELIRSTECENCSVLVAKGNYYIYTSSKSDKIQLSSNIYLYGGFSGDEIYMCERDWINNETVLDGHMNSESPEQVYHVVVGNTGAVIDGFTITGGRARGDSLDGFGGGLLNFNGASTDIVNCNFTENTAGIGGAIANHTQSESTISNSTFSNNSASSGGAIASDYSSDIVISNSIFFSNSGQDGGAIHSYLSNVEIVNSLIFNNACSSRGCGIYSYGWNTKITNTTITGNRITSSSHSDGGGILLTEIVIHSDTQQ
jgi:predicted outer membrane repeat protein